MAIRFQSSVLFVGDIETSRRFYEELLGQKVVMDHGENVVFEGGFAIWQRRHAWSIIHGDKTQVTSLPAGCSQGELYFESDNLDDVLSLLTEACVEFVHPLVEQPWGQRVLRVYDPDKTVIEIGEPMEAVILRYHGEGLLAEDITLRTSMPLELVRKVIAERAV